MKDIIIEVKNRDDLKSKIFKFIISAVDVFRTSPEKFLKELNVILEQVKINFKEMVKQNVGNTEDVKKFIKSDNSSTYVANNDSNNRYVDNTKSTIENNQIIENEKKTNYIYVKREKTEYEKKANKEFDLYNGFNVKSYGIKYLSLDISNKFEANNNNNNYQEINGIYTSQNNKLTKNEVENIYIYEEPEKKDILKSLFNVDKKNGTPFSIDIDTSNTIRANNNNNKIEILNRTEIYENNNVTQNTISNYNKNIYNEEKPKIKKEISYKENDHIDVLNNEIMKKNINDSKSDVYTRNYKSNYCKVNNNNSEVLVKKTEKIVKNSDIVINNENNYDDVKIEPKYIDIDYNSNTNIKNQNNNKILVEEEKKLELVNKEVNIKKENDLIVGKEIKDKLGNENKNYIKEKEEEERKRREEEERKKKEEEERKKKEEEEERKRKEK